MNDVVAALRREHTDISRLLDILERQIESFERESEPDPEIIEAIADYFQSYPDLYHHPKEDLVFQKLTLRDRAAAARVGNLQQEHEELAARTRELASTIHATLEGKRPPRRSLAEVAGEFIALQRDHMSREDRLFFPSALAALTPADWVDIKHRMTDQADPLFGAAVGGRYKALHRNIVQWTRRDSGS